MQAPPSPPVQLQVTAQRDTGLRALTRRFQSQVYHLMTLLLRDSAFVCSSLGEWVLGPPFPSILRFEGDKTRKIPRTMPSTQQTPSNHCSLPSGGDQEPSSPRELLSLSRLTSHHRLPPQSLLHVGQAPLQSRTGSATFGLPTWAPPCHPQRSPPLRRPLPFPQEPLRGHVARVVYFLAS